MSEVDERQPRKLCEDLEELSLSTFPRNERFELIFFNEVIPLTGSPSQFPLTMISSRLTHSLVRELKW